MQAGALAGKRRGQFGAVGAVGEFAVEAGEVGGADADTAECQGEVGRAVVEGGERQAVFFEPARESIGTDAGQQAHRRGVARFLQGFGEGDAAQVLLVVVRRVVAAFKRGVVDEGLRVHAVAVQRVEGDVGFQGAAGRADGGEQVVRAEAFFVVIRRAAEVGAGFAAGVVEDERGEVAARRALFEGGAEGGFELALQAAVEGGAVFAAFQGEGGVVRRVLREGVRRRVQRFAFGVSQGFFADDAARGGAVEDAVARGTGADGVGQAVRRLWQGDEPGGFAGGEFGRGFAEVVPGTGADTFEVAAHRREGGIAVEDGRFVVVVFELQGAQALFDFAAEVVRGVVVEARRLHGEGGGTGNGAPSVQVLPQGTQDGADFDAVMRVVAAVFVVEQEFLVGVGQGARRQAAFAVGGEVAVQYGTVAVVDDGRVVGAGADVGRVGSVETQQGEDGE